MPSNLPIIKVRTQADNITKAKVIAEFRNQSVSKFSEKLILEEIEKFESEHGVIEIYQMSIDEIVEDLRKRVQKKPPYGDNV